MHCCRLCTEDSIRHEIINTERSEGEVCTGFCWRNLRERDHWGDPDVDGRMILRRILRKWEGLWKLDGVGSG